MEQQEYQELFVQLPKKTHLWNMGDMKQWLEVIGLSQLYPRFREAGIDGSCLPQMHEKEVKEKLGVKSLITCRKLQKWIRHKLKQYDEYIEQKQPQPPRRSSLEPAPHASDLILTHSESKKCYYVTHPESVLSEKGCQPLLCHKNYSQQEGAKALLSLEEEQPQIRGFGSTQLYVVVKDRMKLGDGMIIEVMGFGFRVDIKDGQLLLVCFELAESVEVHDFLTVRVDGMSGKPSCKVTFGHSLFSITFRHQEFYLSICDNEVDIWVSMAHLPCLVKEGIKIRVGKDQRAKFVFNFFAPIPEPQHCIICQSEPKNCLFLKCHHNATCIECGRQLKRCPVCWKRISETLTLIEV